MHNREVMKSGPSFSFSLDLMQWLGFFYETIFGFIPVAAAVVGIWTWYAREHRSDLLNSFDVATLNTTALAVLSFLLPLRLNDALAANKRAYTAYSKACNCLEVFQQRLLMHDPSERQITRLMIFLPMIIKHVIRGDFNIDRMNLSEYDRCGPCDDDYDENSCCGEDFELYEIHGDPPNKLKSALRPFKRRGRYADDGASHELLNLKGKLKTAGHYDMIEQVEMLILYQLKLSGAWNDLNIMQAWTDYRTASGSIGGYMAHSKPVAFTAVIYIGLLVVTATNPYIINASVSTRSAVTTSVFASLLLLMMHLNAGRIANPFLSSNARQTVTRVCRACTEDLLCTVALLRGDDQNGKSNAMQTHKPRQQRRWSPADADI